MEKTKEEVIQIIAEELKQQMMRDGKTMGATPQMINQAIAAASMSISITSENIANRLFA